MVTDTPSSNLESDLDRAVFAPEAEAQLDANSPLPVQVATVSAAFADLTARLMSLAEVDTADAPTEAEQLFSASALNALLNTHHTCRCGARGPLHARQEGSEPDDAQGA